jgi:predicted dithiol-disulfide oxidoreductase (DUF899 family)
MNYPDVVSRQQWQEKRRSFLKEEKEATRAQDALNARRRRLPMTPMDRPYTFGSTRGELQFADLFEGRPQLIIYHNMLAAGLDHVCSGCSYYCDHVGNLEHLNARRTTFAVVARATVPEIERVKSRLGWSFPWYSCFGTTFHEDFVESEGESFGLSVFIRRGNDIYQTYFTSGRGVEQPSNTFGFLDITPWGRQELWEDSPDGWPQEPAHTWRRVHDEYGSKTTIETVRETEPAVVGASIRRR